MNKIRFKKLTVSLLTFMIAITASTNVVFSQELHDKDVTIKDIDSTEELVEEGVPKDDTVEKLTEIDTEEDLNELDINDEEIQQDQTITQDNILKNTDYIIENSILRSAINNSLGKDENYNASEADLKRIIFLKIEPNNSGFNSNEYLEIDSFKGIEMLVNLESLSMKNIIMPEESINDISKLENLTYFGLHYSFFTGTNDESTILKNTSINNSPKKNVTLNFNSYVSLEPISQLSNLEYIQIAQVGTLKNGTDFGNAKTGFDLTGWENLKNLKYLWLEGAASLNDNSMTFLKELPNLEELTLYNTSLNSVEELAQLDENTLRLLQLSFNDVLDFMPIVDKKYFRHSNQNLITDILEFYTEDESQPDIPKVVSVNTGIIVNDNLSDVELKSYSLFDNSMIYQGYEVHNNVLYLHFDLKDLVDFKLKALEENYHGFMVITNLIFDTKDGNKKITFDIPVNIGKTVRYVISDNFESVGYYKPFELITPITTPYKEGYIFETWTLDKEGTEVFDFSVETFDNQVLYAQWRELDKFTVNFDSRGGSEVTPLLEVVEGSLIAAPQNPKKTGYKFNGWFTNTNFDKQWDFSTDLINSDLVLYAKWTPIEYTIIFDQDNSDGGLDMEQVTLKYDENYILETPTFTKTGYTFKSWLVSNEEKAIGDTVKNLTTEDNTTVTIKALYSAHEYTINFDSNGGLGNMDSISAVYDHEFKLPASTFTRDGYKFEGWATSHDGDLVYTNEAMVKNLSLNDTVTLFAVWSAHEYEIHIDTKDIEIDIEDLSQSIEKKTTDSLIITKSNAKGYIMNTDGTKEELPVYVHNAESLSDAKVGDTIDLTLSLVEQKSMTSRDLDPKSKANTEIKVRIVDPKIVDNNNNNNTDTANNTVNKDTTNKPSTGIEVANTSLYVLLISVGSLLLTILFKKRSKKA